MESDSSSRGNLLRIPDARSSFCIFGKPHQAHATGGIQGTATTFKHNAPFHLGRSDTTLLHWDGRFETNSEALLHDDDRARTFHNRIRKRCAPSRETGFHIPRVELGEHRHADIGGNGRSERRTKAYIWPAERLVFFFVEECNDGRAG